MWKMLSVYYQILISVITKIEESLNLNLAEPSEWKALPFVLVELMSILKNSSRCSTNKRAFIISKKSKWNSKSKHKLFEKHGLVNMLIIDSKKSNEKTQIHEQIKIISKRLTVFYPEFLGYTSIYSYCVLDLSQHQWHFVI